MKVFVSIDMEGITGVCVETQTDQGHSTYGRAAEFMRGDLDAVLAGCEDAGASEVVVRDAHDYSTNLDVLDLPANVSLLTGRAGLLGMMEGLDESFDAVLLVGYHAMAGTAAAVLDHTYCGLVHQAFAGDLELGELGFNAGVAARFGVPVVFASGDDKLAAEAAACLPGVTTVTTKQGVARGTARLLSPRLTAGLLREGVKDALAGPPPGALDLSGKPVRIVFTKTQHCDAACSCPAARRVDGRTVEIEADDYLTVYAAFMAALDLAGSVA